MRVLIVEDNPKTALAVSKGLARHGYIVDVSHSGQQGEELAAAGGYELVLLDQMLPDRGGMDVCRNLRARNIGTPIILMTALTAPDAEADAFQSGANDAITKPFAFEELLARVRALGPREKHPAERTLRSEGLELDLHARKATRAGESISLSKKEVALLEFFMRHPGRILTREEIGQWVWGSRYEPNGNSIEVYVSTLRRKLDRGHDRPLFHTIKGAGYRFGWIDPSPSP